MNKFPLIAILTLLLVVMGVNADPSFNIVEDFVNITGTHQQTKQGSFTVDNNGTENLSITFSSFTLTNGGTPLTISSLSDIANIPNGTSQIVNFDVVIPDKQKPGLYTGTITASSVALPNIIITVNVDVTPSYTVSTIPVSEMNLGKTSLNTAITNLLFNITNTGNANLTNVSFDFSKSGFNLQANKTNFILAFDTTETIKFNITIPKSSSTGNLTLGFVKIDSTELGNFKLFDLKAEVGGGLIIEDLDVFLATRIRRKSDGTLGSGSGNDLDVFDGRKLKFDDENVGPESELRFNFNIENTFSDEDDIDIDDITVKVTIEELDDGDDIDEESNEFNLDSDNSDDVDIIIKIPLSVDVGIYDVVIEVEGGDADGNKHTVQMNLKIDIDKEARNVIVSEASLFPDKVKCTGSSTLTATIKNIGSKIEDEAMIEIINSDLNINFVRRNIDLEEDPFDIDNEYTKKLIINIGRDTEAGTYPIEVNSYLQEQILWETKTINFVVEACSQAVTPEEEVQEEETTVETETVSDTGVDEETSEGEEIPVLEPATTTEVPLTKNPLFWVGIVLLNILVIGAVVFFAVKAVGKK